MKERKNILLLIGAIFSLFPLYTFYSSIKDYLIDLGTAMPIGKIMTEIGSAVINLLPAIIAIIQIICSERNRGKWIVPPIGIAISGYFLISGVVTILPSLQVYVTLNLLSSAKFIINIIMSWGFGTIGHIILLIGHIISLPKRNA